MSNTLLADFNDPFDNHGAPIPDGEVQNKRVAGIECAISKIKKLTYDTYEVTVKSKSSDFFLAKPGQYGTLKIPGIQKPRAYSFAKIPDQNTPDEVAFFIRLVEGGEVSNWLESSDRVGQDVVLSGPMGKFGLDTSDADIVCIAGGSGMSAIRVIVNNACKEQVARNCYFFYGARTQADLYCLEEMQAITQQWNSNFTFKFIPVLSEEPEESDWQGPRGFVTEHFNENYLAKGEIKTADMKAFFCGPPAMIDHGVSLLEAAGLASEDIRFDRFEDARSPAPVIDNTKCVLCDICLLVTPQENCIIPAGDFKRNGAGAQYQLVKPANTSGLYYNALFVNESECIRCNACLEACPHGAISPDNSTVPQVLRVIEG